MLVVFTAAPYSSPCEAMLAEDFITKVSGSDDRHRSLHLCTVESVWSALYGVNLVATHPRVIQGVYIYCQTTPVV